MNKLSEEEKRLKADLIEQVIQTFEGDDAYGLPRDRAEQEAHGFLSGRDPSLGQDPKEPEQGIRRIEGSPEQVLMRAKDAATYEP